MNRALNTLRAMGGILPNIGISRLCRLRGKRRYCRSCSRGGSSLMSAQYKASVTRKPMASAARAGYQD